MLSLKSIFTNTLGTLLSKILGLFKNIFVNFYFGLIDTFWGAFQIVNTFRIFVGEGAINNILIPLYKRCENENKPFLKYFVAKSFLFISILSLLLTIALILLSYPLAKITLSGFSENKITETSNLISIMSVAVTLISLQSFLAAIQIAKYNSFIGFAFAPVVANILTIITIALLNYTGVYILSWSVVIGSLGMLLFQILFFIKDIKNISIPFKEIVNIDEYTKKFILGFFSLIALSLTIQLNGIVSRLFGSFFEGVVAAISNAYILIQAPIGMFTVAVSIVGLNTLSELYSKNDLTNFRKLSNESIKTLNLFIIPITIVFIVFGDDIVKAVYRDISGIILGSEGKYSQSALRLTQELFSIYAISTYFISLNSLLTKITFSRRKNIIPILNSIINLFLDVTINLIIFLTIRSYLGIPISFLIATIVSTLHIFIIENENIHNKKEIFIELLKISLATILTTLTIKILFNLITFKDTYITSIIITFIKVTLSLTLTITLCYILKIQSANTLVNRIKKVFK